MRDPNRGRVTRRSFLATSAAGAAGLALPSTALSRSRILGSNEAVRIGVIGLNGRGAGLAGSFRNVDLARVVAYCDCDSAVLDRRVAEAQKKHGEAPQAFTDPRKLLDSGERGTMSVKKGDVVFYGKYSGTEVEVGGETYVIVREGDILAIVD